MMYTVKNLAKLSGISVRTLHFYDEIGLLKPAHYGDNKYRYYKEEQLLILQQILFFRELEFPLDKIKEIIGSTDFDKIKALMAHKDTLEKSIGRMLNLISTIDNTIEHLRGNVSISAGEIFKGFDPKKQIEYEKYLVNSQKVTQKDLNTIRRKYQKLSDIDKEKFKLEGITLNKELALAIGNGYKPTSAEVQELIKRHYQWIKQFWIPNAESYIEIAKLYREHEDFKNFFGTYHHSLAEFLSEAMQIFAKRELL